MFTRTRIWIVAGIAAAVMTVIWRYDVAAAKSMQGLAVRDRFLTQEYGRDVGHGNILGVQPAMDTADYRSKSTFFAKLDLYLAIAKRKGWTTSQTVVVFPEVIGFYLVAAGEAQDVYKAKSLEVAAAMMLRTHESELSTLDAGPMPDDPILRARRMLLVYKSSSMAEIYQQSFSELARRYDVTIVAGTIFLPSPAVMSGKIVCDSRGPLNNISAVFRPDGTIFPQLVHKAFPPREEVQKLGIQRGDVESLPVFPTPAGRIGVAICADSWFPRAYEVLDRQGAAMILTPSQYGDTAYMSQPWHGYSLSPGLKTPADVDLSDVEKLKEGEAWIKYAMPGRMGQTVRNKSKARYGMTVFSRGRFWEESSEGGDPFIIRNGKLVSRPSPSGAPAIISLWLE